MKTIGILGGTGPQATMDFEQRLHRAAQRLLQIKGNSGYPPVVVYYHRRPPVVVDDHHMPVLPLRPDPDYLAAAAWLGARADFLVIPANGPHLFRKEIEHAAGKPLLSIIDATLDEVRRLGWRTVGVFGFPDHRIPVYAEPLRARSQPFELIDAALQARLNDAVFSLLEGRETPESRAVAAECLASLRSRGVDGIIPGCTEIPLLLGDLADAPDLVNPAQLLAEAAVRHAAA